MRMDFLEIEQFRGIRGLELKQLGDVNLLLGDNDSGKTNVLEAIKMFEAPDDIDAIIRNASTRTPSIRSIARDNYTPLEYLLSIFPFAQRYKQVMMSAGIDGEICKFAIEGELAHILRPVPEQEVRGIYPREKRMNMLLTEQEVLAFHGKLYSNEESSPVEIDEFYRPQIFLRRAQSFLPIVYMSPGEHLPVRNNFSIYRTSKVQEGEIVKLLQLIDPEIEGYKLLPNSTTGSSNQTIEHKRFGNVPLYACGDGMKKVLSLAANIMEAKGGILLIDEIETSL